MIEKRSYLFRTSWINLGQIYNLPRSDQLVSLLRMYDMSKITADQDNGQFSDGSKHRRIIIFSLTQKINNTMPHSTLRRTTRRKNLTKKVGVRAVAAIAGGDELADAVGGEERLGLVGVDGVELLGAVGAGVDEDAVGAAGAARVVLEVLNAVVDLAVDDYPR